MKSIFAFTLSLICSLAALAQPADGVVLEPQNMPLNMENQADAYSWLSKDGLRLYFTRDNSSDEIWKAERKSISDEFINPKSISIDGVLGDDIFSCWLTEDEKTVFFVTHENNGVFSTTLYRACYNEQSKSFKNPLKINLTGAEISVATSIFISGPSLTADLSQLFVYYNGDHSNERIASFTSQDGINYEFKSFLNNADNCCPGSLADNGLSFYLTLRNEDNLLVKLTRTDLNSEFGNPTYFIIDSSINTDKNYYQPCVNSELGIISLTYGIGTWESNNLAIITIPTQKTDYSDNVAFIPPSVDSISSVDINFEEKPENNILVDTISSIKFDWVFTDEVLIADSFATIAAFQCTYEYTVPNVVFLDETLTDDTLAFDTEDDFSTPVSNNRTDLNSFLGMPNPASSSFRIIYDIKTNSSERPFFELTNLNGQVIKRFELESTSGNFDIDINGLAEGLYLYRVITSDFASEVKKLVVKR
jgi:hypothetical protein